MTSSSCMRCGRLALTQVVGNGLLRLCAACPVASAACAEYAHDYGGSTTAGTWVCRTCGHTLTSQPVSPAVVPAETPTQYDVYC